MVRTEGNETTEAEVRERKSWRCYSAVSLKMEEGTMSQGMQFLEAEKSKGKDSPLEPPEGT